MQRTSPRSKRLWVGGIFGAFALGVVGLVLLGARGASVIPPHAPMPSPNGFDLYAAAAKALTKPNPPVDEINDSRRATPQEAAQNYTPARRAAWVAANTRSWGLMKQARAAGSQHPDIRANVMARLPLGPMRDLARAKTIEAKHFKDLKRWDKALESGLDLFQMGRDIEHGAPLIGSLVGMAVESIGATSLENVPSHLSAPEAIAGVRRLQGIIAGAATPADVLREEKWTTLTLVRQNFGANSSGVTKAISGPFAAPIGSMMDAYIVQSEKPYGLQVTPPVPSGFFNTYAAILHSSPKGYGLSVARREALESLLLVRLALRAHRVERGSYPATLSSLAPQYLAKVPRDPFGSGEALRFRKSGDSYVVWSIGPDGKDDGGKPIPIKPGKKRAVVDKKAVGDVVARP